MKKTFLTIYHILCNKNVSLLKQIVTDGEKWILYNNMQQLRSCGKQNEPPPTIPKASLHPKKAMLCIWWDWNGVFYYELLLETKQFQQVLLPIRPTESSTRWKASGISQQKMHNLPSAQHKPACFSDDQEKALQPRWEVLIHLLCSPDNAPSDCHLSQYV